MATHKNDDFVWVRPKPGYGSVAIVHGPFHCAATLENPAKLTRGEWAVVFKEYEEFLELCDQKDAASIKNPLSGSGKEK